jgi:2-oxoglutarate ferredoxin oxidoreductase subunit beta
MDIESVSKEHSYLRIKKKFPTVWCSGCGIGAVMAAIIRSVDELQINKNNVALVSGIGCSSRIPIYVDFNTLHTTHGRAIPFATGIKMVRPDMKVIVVSGDGDALAIGGNHFIHACRRNIDITFVLINNHIYGMTGGQASPTTPQGKISHTTPYGSIDPPFDAVEIASAAGASYVARASNYHIVQASKYITKALDHRGMSVVEVVSNCPTLFGRLNKMKSPVDQLKWQKDFAIPMAKWEKMTREERSQAKIEGHFAIGEFVTDMSRPEYTDLYEQLKQKIREEGNNGK